MYISMIFINFTEWYNHYHESLLEFFQNPPANAGDAGDEDSIPGSRLSTEGGNSNPLQYSCLKNPMDKGTWQDTVQGVAKSWTQLSTHTFRPVRSLMLISS